MSYWWSSYLALIVALLVSWPEAYSQSQSTPIQIRDAAAVNCDQLNLNKRVSERPFFLVNQLGNVLKRSSRDITERDQVFVRLFVSKDLAPFIKIRRQTDFRAIGAINIVGADASVPRQAAQAPSSQQCAEVDAYVSDFAGGKPGAVEILINTGTAEAVIGSFDFAVAPLYTGAFALGPIYTWLQDPAFGVVTSATGESIISVTHDDAHRVLYALTYTPFIWGRRNIEEDLGVLNIKHFNPLIGIVLNDISNNAIIGASYDLFYGSVYITAGVHAGRVHEIDPHANLAIGQAVDAPDFVVPTRTLWKTQGFVGLTFDLRAALSLFKTASSSSIDAVRR